MQCLLIFSFCNDYSYLLLKQKGYNIYCPKYDDDKCNKKSSVARKTSEMISQNYGR